MKSVTVVSIGPGDPEFLNEKTKKAILESKKLILRTGRHPLVKWLNEVNIPFVTLDHLYQESDTFETLLSSILAEIRKAAELLPTVYAVADAMTDRSVDYLFINRPEETEITVIPGFSYADYYLSACKGLVPTADIRICPARDFLGKGFDPSLPLLITELNDGITAGEVKQDLSGKIDDESVVYFFDDGTAPHPILLYELDRQPAYSHLSAVAVSGYTCFERRTKSLRDLMEIMDQLRSREGCPWDRAQTHDTLKPYLIEEAWEVIGSIEEKRPDHLAEELGDLLFQIVFHTSIAQDFDEFSMDDVITGICDKMIRRHPHVFDNSYPEGMPFTAEAWDRIKQSESGCKSFGESMNRISTALPALKYAEKLIRKLSRLSSFHRSDREIADTLSGISEMLVKEDAKSRQEKWIADLLICCTELAYSRGLDCELILHQTVRKIIQAVLRFEKDGKDIAKCPESLTFNDLGVY